jgi:hypothetical protein
VVDGVTGTVPGVVDGVTGALPDVLGPVTEGLLADGLLNINVDIDLDANLAAPVAGAVSANANIAAPIDAAVAANVLSFDSSATAVSNQTAIITQTLDDVTAEATAAQNATITQ